MADKNEQVETLKNILHKLSEGASVDEVKAEFAASFGTVDASEIAAAEAELIRGGTPVEEILSLCNVHAAVVEGSVSPVTDDYPQGHPLTIFYEENNGLERFLAGEYAAAKKAFLEKEDKKSYLSALAKLEKIDRHYARKENLFFPYMERNNITAPPKVMWGKDDEIRALIKKVKEQVSAEIKDEELFSELEFELLGMVQKENEILKPMLLDSLKEEDWRVVAAESSQFGYVFVADVEGASPSDAAAWLKGEEELNHRTGTSDIELPSGYFNAYELEAMLNSLPHDITYVNKDDKVQYFSEGKQRVFPRTRTIIGRLVEDCHPPKSLDRVLEVVESFKSGEKDEESFWLQKDDMFILIRYYAVRGKDGEYLGVAEVTEEISALRKLEGNKILLTD